MSEPKARALPPEAYAAALAGLPEMGPARLAAVLQAWPPADAWERVTAKRVLGDAGVVAACGRRAGAVVDAWRWAAATVDVAERWTAHVEAGVEVAVLGRERYPLALAADHEAPAVLFAKGDLAAVDHPAVAIVGSRRCTRYGLDVARELGRDLASAGVRVVSGLALGIDGAAHTGALAARAAPPVGVVGSGLDVVYPRRHAALWAEVAAAGALLSEAPLGAAPEAWRFPARNRILAALADVVVVVESRLPGGSVHTVTAAETRARTVMAVPGPVRSPASAYTNALLVDGCPPARDVVDVLVALGLSGAALPARTTDRCPEPEGNAAAVLDALGWEPATLDDLVGRTGLLLGEVSVALVALERDGWVSEGVGWWERKEASPQRRGPEAGDRARGANSTS